MLVTRDYGREQLGARIVQDARLPVGALTLLRGAFKTSADSGGGVVAIDGLAGGPGGWSLYVNGIGAGRDVAAVEVHGGDRLWWDRHDRGAAPRVRAVVGSFPEPFLHGTGGKRFPVVLECAEDAGAACTTVQSRLAAAGVHAARQLPGTGAGELTLRVFVGTWAAIRGDAALEQLDRGPAVSGVYARFARGGRALELLDPAGRVARTRGAGAGLVAATRFERQAPTWAITGTDPAGVAAAARALGERTLQARFALAVGPGGADALPVARP